MHDDELRGRLDVLQARVDQVVVTVNAISRSLLKFRKIEQETDMATQQTLDALTANVQANTDAAAAAALALQGFVATVTDLTAQLQAAIAADDEVAIKAAADAIAANNATLTAAIPAVSEAVVENTV